MFNTIRVICICNSIFVFAFKNDRGKMRSCERGRALEFRRVANEKRAAAIAKPMKSAKGRGEARRDITSGKGGSVYFAGLSSYLCCFVSGHVG